VGVGGAAAAAVGVVDGGEVGVTVDFGRSSDGKATDFVATGAINFDDFTRASFSAARAAAGSCVVVG
jgi:hypothetical protein